MPQRTPITEKQIQEQLAGLKRTQAAECTIRRDIICSVIGEEDTDRITLARVSMASKKNTKGLSLLEAKKRLEAEGPTESHEMITIDREAGLEAMLGALEAREATQKKGISPEAEHGASLRASAETSSPSSPGKPTGEALSDSDN